MQVFATATALACAPPPIHTKQGPSNGCSTRCYSSSATFCTSSTITHSNCAGHEVAHHYTARRVRLCAFHSLRAGLPAANLVACVQRRACTSCQHACMHMRMHVQLCMAWPRASRQRPASSWVAKQ